MDAKTTHHSSETTRENEKTETAFTPGPWQAFGNERGGMASFVIDTALGVPSTNDYVIADYIVGPQAEANARLIAAAPELYEVAGDALELLNSEVITPAALNRVGRALEAVLSKARSANE